MNRIEKYILEILDNKINKKFKQDTKIGTKYQNSPFYKGCKLWEKLTREIQFCDSITLFKQHVKIMYNVFETDFYV